MDQRSGSIFDFGTGVGQVISEIISEVDQQRTTYYDRPVEDVPGTKHVRQRSVHQFSFLFPLCLLGSVFERGKVDLILAYALDERTKLAGRSDLKGTPEYTDVEQIMDALKIRFDQETYTDLLDQAQRYVLDYQTRYTEHKLPMAKIHQGVLLDAYRGDLPLDYFVVYAGIKSVLDLKQMPQRVTVAQILRRAHGFHSRRSFDFGIKSEAFAVRLSYHKVRRITLALARRHHFFQRATVGLWTWYATDGILKACGIKSLHQYALNVAKKNKRLELKDQREQIEINQEWQRVKEDVAEEKRRLKERRDALKRQHVVKQMVQARLTAEDLQQEFGFRPYRRSDVSDTHWQAMRHELVVDGETFGVNQTLSSEVQTQLTQRGVKVVR